MSASNQTSTVAVGYATSPRTKILIVAIMGFMAFLLSYNYAVANSADGAGGSDLFAQSAGGGCGMSGGSGGGGGCCGGGGPEVEGAAVIEGGVQRIAVDTSSGSFSPNVIKATAGVPIVLDFSQAPGGCLSGVYFPDFGIDEDLTRGGKTVELPALDAGEYQFFCQMQMVSAKIVVE